MIDIIDGYRSENNIFAEDIGEYNISMWGAGDYVLPVGEQLAYTMIHDSYKAGGNDATSLNLLTFVVDKTDPSLLSTITVQVHEVNDYKAQHVIYSIIDLSF